MLILCFVAGGVYITGSIDKVMTRLENINTLHKVEFLRKTLLQEINVVQTDLLLKDSPHARNIDVFVGNVEQMVSGVDSCFDCHHDPLVLQQITEVRDDINEYAKKLSRVYTLRANLQRLNREKQNAFAQGQNVISKVDRIVVTSSEKVASRVLQARNKIEETKNLVTALLVIGPLAIVMLALIFVRFVIDSVGTLTRATRKLKEGNLHYRIDKRLQDEFQELAVAFNDMATSIEAQYRNMQHTERLAAVGEFAAGLAHEVKNPLAGIKVSIEVLANDLPLEPDDKDIFARIINEVNRIETLLKSLLNYARPPKPKATVLNLNQLLEKTIATSQYTLKSTTSGPGAGKYIKFITEFGRDIPDITADPGQLQQIFLNLLLNAIDAIRDQGTISISTVSKDDGYVQVIIADTGRGIEPDVRNNIFNPFFTTKPKGTGLGLAICKRLIEQQGGSIKVDSVVGEGAVFTLLLPYELIKEGEK